MIPQLLYTRPQNIQVSTVSLPGPLPVAPTLTTDLKIHSCYSFSGKICHKQQMRKSVCFSSAETNKCALAHFYKMSLKTFTKATSLRDSLNTDSVLGVRSKENIEYIILSPVFHEQCHGPLDPLVQANAKALQACNDDSKESGAVKLWRILGQFWTGADWDMFRTAVFYNSTWCMHWGKLQYVTKTGFNSTYC